MGVYQLPKDIYIYSLHIYAKCNGQRNQTTEHQRIPSAGRDHRLSSLLENILCLRFQCFTIAISMPPLPYQVPLPSALTKCRVVRHMVVRHTMAE